MALAQACRSERHSGANAAEDLRSQPLSYEVARQLFFILLGVATMEMPNRTETLGAGEAIDILPGAPHQMHNRSDNDLEFLVISQPPSHGDKVSLNPNSSDETK